MEKGDTFLMGAPGGTKKHLWVILSELRKFAGCGVIVNFSTDEVRSGAECPLCPAEHPWLKEPRTWVCFGDAVLMSPEGWAKIETGISRRMIVPKEKCSDDLLAKIIQEAKASAAKPKGAFRKDYLPYLD